MLSRLTLDSTVVINVLINTSSPKLKPVFFISKHRVHEYLSELTSTPHAELFCTCKRRKFIDQHQVKMCTLSSQNYMFLVEKIGCPSYDLSHLN